MSCFRCCILGMENTGKTDYVQKISGFHIDSSSFQILSETKHANIENGKTAPESYYINKYSLCYCDNRVFEFSVNDYSGTLLKSRDENTDAYKKFKLDLKKSDFLIIMIDGDYFVKEDKEAIVKTLRRKCVRFINPCIAYCSEQHNDNLPPLLFAITKCNRFMNKYTKSELSDLIQEAFNGIFSDETEQYIMCMDNEANLAVKIPIYLSIANSLKECAAAKKAELLDANAKMKDRISDNQNFLREQENRLLLKNPFKMKEARETIADLQMKIQQNNTTLSNDPIFKQNEEFRSVVNRELRKNFNYLVYGFHVEPTEAVKKPDRNKIVSFAIGFIVLLFLYELADITLWDNPYWYTAASVVISFVYNRKYRFVVPFFILLLTICVIFFIWSYVLLIIGALAQIGMLIGFYLKKSKNTKK